MASGSDGAEHGSVPDRGAAEQSQPEAAGQQSPAASEGGPDAGGEGVAGGSEARSDEWAEADEAALAEAEVEQEEDWFSGKEDVDEDAEEEGWHDGDNIDIEMEDEMGLEELLVAEGELDDEDWDEDDEAELQEWAEFMEQEADALSQSSEEPEMEQTASSELAAATEGQYMERPFAAYRIPTAHYHFQSADALSLASGYASPDGSHLLATFDKQGVAAWLVPSAGRVASLGPEHPQSAVRLGGFQHPSDIFSMTCSPDGRYIVTGGESGILSIYTVDPSAPPRKPGPTRPVAISGVTYFYTPLVTPAAAAAAAAAAQQAGGQGPMVAVVAAAGAAAAVILGGGQQAEQGGGQVGQQTEQQQAGQRQAMGSQAGGSSQQAGGAQQQPQHAQQGAQQAQQQRGAEGFASQQGAVMLAALVGLGLREMQNQFQAPFNDDSMLNGVRFGLVGGKQRLVAAEQSGYVYVLETPPSSMPRGRVYQHLFCSGLGEPSPHWRMMPVSMFRGVEVPVGVEARRESRWKRTAAIGPFDVPVNMAVPSPDGKWLAVVGDCQALFLVDQGAGYRWERLEFDIKGSRAHLPQDMSIGAQYCSWHPDSSQLAVTSDGLLAAFVFDVASRRLLYRIEGHKRPCLGVMFAPWDPSLLLYNEETKHVFLREGRVAQEAGDISAAEELAAGSSAAGVQLLRAPIIQPEAGPGGLLAMSSRRRRITGMAAGAGGDLFVATKQGAVLRYFARLPWTPSRHHLWPAAFREQARQLLLCCHRRPPAQQAQQRGGGEGSGGAAVGLWTLPEPIVLHIVEALAGSRTDWLGG